MLMNVIFFSHMYLNSVCVNFQDLKTKKKVLTLDIKLSHAHKFTGTKNGKIT